MHQVKSRARPPLPTFVWGAFILIMTSWPQPPSFGPSGTDKVGHFAIYFVLGVLSAPLLAHSNVPRRTALVFGALALLFAALDELHQLIVPGRSASAADWVADALGATSGIAVAFAFNSFRRKSK